MNIKEILENHALWLTDSPKGIKANLEGANLKGANLEGAILPNYKIVPETGSFIAYKKVSDSKILTLEIAKDAVRISSLVGRKCRASKVRVLKAETLDGKKLCSEMQKFYSMYDKEFSYQIGKIAEVKNFNADIRIECADGIHFFMTKQEAIDFIM